MLSTFRLLTDAFAGLTVIASVYIICVLMGS